MNLFREASRCIWTCFSILLAENMGKSPYINTVILYINQRKSPVIENPRATYTISGLLLMLVTWMDFFILYNLTNGQLFIENKTRTKSVEKYVFEQSLLHCLKELENFVCSSYNGRRCKEKDSAIQYEQCTTC